MRTLSLTLTMLLCQTAGAARPVTTVLIAPTSLDAQVPAPLPVKVGEIMATQLAHRDEVQLVVPRRLGGRDPASPLPEARSALSAGEQNLRQFKFADAQQKFEQAVSAIEAAGIPPSETATLTSALVDLARLHAQAGRRSDARETCNRLLTLRPRVVLDPVNVPPNVLSLCEAVRQERARFSPRDVSLSTTPAFAQAIVDGEASGTTPVTLQLGTGRHYFILSGKDQPPIVQTVDVEPGTVPMNVHFDLPTDPLVALENTLRGRLQHRGPQPESADAASALGLAAPARQVIVVGIEHGTGDSWRIYSAVLASDDGRLVRTVVSEIDPDLGDAPDVLGRAIDALLLPEGVDRFVVLPHTRRALADAMAGLDFEKHLFGVTKVTAATPTVVPAPPIAPPTTAPAPGANGSLTSAESATAYGYQPRSTPAPEHKKKRSLTGLWVTLGVVAALGIAAGVYFEYFYPWPTDTNVKFTLPAH